jgi:O-antigen/teichoic acid export membrane protein
MAILLTVVKDRIFANRDRNWLSATSLIGVTVPFVLNPVWSRLYPVEAFALSSLINVIPALAATWSTLAYHTAIQAASNDKEALQLVVISLVSLMVIGVLSLGLAAVANEKLAVVLYGDNKLGWLVSLAPILLIANGFQLIIEQWMIRRGRFRAMALSLLAQPMVTPVFLLGGLAFSDRRSVHLAAMICTSITVLVVRMVLSDLGQDILRERPSWIELQETAKRYRHYPRDVTLSGVLANFASQLPTLVFSRYYGMEAAGHLARANILLSIPGAIATKPTLAMFAREGSNAYRTTGNCRNEFQGYTIKMTMLLGPAFLVLMASAPTLYPWFYGKLWRDAGLYAQPLAVAVLVATIASPASEVFIFSQHTKLDVLWQMMRLSLVAGALVIGASQTTPVNSLILYALALSVSYAINILLAWRISSSQKKVQESSEQ